MSTPNSNVPCPDPSLHLKSNNKLADQASSAALYATHPDRSANARENVLGSDGKLSSKNAATSLKYAKPQDLPSFPSHGYAADSAGKAAMLAKDYKMKDVWQPEMSAAGSKAALLAHKDGGKLDLWHPSASAVGNSAAVLAMRNKTLSPSVDYGYTEEGHSRALMAAAQSVKQGRQRSGSTPTPAHPAYPDSQNSARNALNAATASHRSPSKLDPDGWDSEAKQQARITHLGHAMAPEMFGSNPPVEIETQQEKQHQAALRASTLSMAKNMYDYQNRTALSSGTLGTDAAVAAAHVRSASSSGPKDLKQEAIKYIHLQEAAQKLAQERLAKVDKDLESQRFREHYGYGGSTGSSPKKGASRLSLRGKMRGRASSDGELDDLDDEAQARRIRTQMSQLSTGVGNVDEKKRAEDRARLMAAAQQRVNARMHTLDEKVFADTGKPPASILEAWELKARKRAQEDKELQAQNPGQTHVGGGKFVPTAEIEAIAQARLKPMLDQMTKTAEEKRALDDEVRTEKEESERQKREGKQKHKEEKGEMRRAKDEEKAATRKASDEAKVRKSEDKRKSREHKREEVGDVATGATSGEVAENIKNDEPSAGNNKIETSPIERKDGGVLGRIGNRLRRKKPTDEVGEDGTEQIQEGVDKPVAATGLALGGVALPEAAEQGKADIVADDHAEVVEPVTEQSLPEASTAVRSGQPAGYTKTTDPSTNIHHPHTERQDFDGSDADDEGEEDLVAHHAKRQSEPSEAERKQKILDRVFAAPVIDTQGQFLEPLPSNEVANKTVTTYGHPEREAITVAAHDRDAGNIEDPAVKPDLEDSKGEIGNRPATQDGIKKEDTPVLAPTSTSETKAEARARDIHFGTEGRDQKGILGFFSKLRHRESKPGDKLTDGKGSTSTPTPSSIMPTASATKAAEPHAGTNGTHKNAQHDADDDISATNLGEGDHNGDHEALTAQKTDLGKKPTGDERTLMGDDLDGKPNATGKGEEPSEEARDYFDESRAPPTAFAGQAKGHSAARETRFKELV